ncbi:MAG: hypothetical protein LQ351_006948 [Letrouitia transgressa]|nr:MAG: hypothetical protein LQ351_006948 [Letrouitia transgressa]
MAHPQETNTPTIGCTPPHQLSSPIAPPQIPSRPPATRPLLTHQAIPPTMHRLVGMGVPSKYFDFPVASLGSEETVTLKRARRVRPQRTKKDRRRVSSGVRRPRAKAHAAGETPKETCMPSERDGSRLASFPSRRKNGDGGGGGGGGGGGRRVEIVDGWRDKD